jgi:LuxR family maltose regulon positive regulatory protein
LAQSEISTDAPILESKLQPPDIALVGAARREHLIERILHAPEPVVLVRAPAGYGKTTLLAQCAASRRLPVAWLSLDALDNDPVCLVRELCSAVSRAVAVDPLAREAVAAPEPAIASQILPRLANSLLESGGCLIVLDDAHKLDALESVEVLNQLCEHLPQRVRLIVAARGAPGLSLARLRAGGRLFELGSADLALDAAQAEQLLESMGVSEVATAVLERLLARTEGWPAAIYLAARAARESTDPVQAIAAFDGGDRDIVEYVTSEVLSTLSADRLTFLLRASVLDRLTAELCDSVLERADSASVLEDLVESTSLIVALDRRGEWYRYQRAFRRALRALLQRQTPEVVGSLHERAAQWWLSQGDASQATAHLLLLGDPEAASHAALAPAAAWVQLEAGDATRAARWLALAEQHLGAAADQHGALALPRAVLGQDGVGHMARHAQLALALTPPGHAAHTAAAAIVGASLYLRGRNTEARDTLRRAWSGATVLTGTATLARALLAFIALEEGSIRQAESCLRSLSPAMRSGWADAGVAAAQAWLDVELGDVQAARRDLSHAMDLLPRAAAVPWWAALTASVAARVAIALSEVSRAEALVGEARRNLARFPDCVRLRYTLERQELALASGRGGARVLDEPLTDAELRVLALAPTHLTLEQIGSSLHISRNTVKTHLRAIYGKLEVGTRDEAVQRARALRLLEEVA